jgi:formiminotetrahydrofolate cyclodeaminase
MVVKWLLVGFLSPFVANRRALSEAFRVDLARVVPGLFPEQAKQLADEYRSRIIERRRPVKASMSRLVSDDLNAYRLRSHCT